MAEQIVLVDKTGQAIGSAEKLATHTADTPLHLAFSCYVFNDEGKFLVTQRAGVKKVWPDVWTNSCCGHPAPGESMEQAIRRRLTYELGMTVTEIILLVPDYTYRTTPYNGIIEHEFCPIYAALALTEPVPNSEEVSDYKWMDWPEYVMQSQSDSSDKWSWWCKDQLNHIRENPDLLSLTF